jgi:holo-[acyl-carrier protein] synthase
MAIVGIGIDIIEVERVKRALSDERTGARFRARVFAEGEIVYCESRGLPRFESYAARFAAKEAVMKSMATGWGPNARWNEIEVVREESGAPTILLHGKAAEFARRHGVRRFHLSLSHTAESAIAYAIAED